MRAAWEFPPIAFAVSLVILAAGVATAAPPPGVPDARLSAAEALLVQYPGLGFNQLGARRVFFGLPMVAGPTPDAATRSWLEAHAGVFGVDGKDLVCRWSAEIAGGAGTVLAYSQVVRGIPVEFCQLRVLTQRFGFQSRVVYAAGDLARIPAGVFAAKPRLGADGALRRVLALGASSDLTEWTPAESVIVPDHLEKDLAQPVLAWKLTGRNPDLQNYAARTFYLDADTGRVVHVREEVYFTDVDGHIEGNATPGLGPHGSRNPPVAVPLARTRVGVVGGAAAFSDENGDFQIPHAGGAPVQLTAGPLGEWVTVSNSAGPELTDSVTVTPPGPASLFLNSLSDEFGTAQVNALVHTNAVYDFFTSRIAGGVPLLDVPLAVNVNIGTDCNAFFTPPQTLNFFRSGSSCPNTAYSTVIFHEYGHFILHRLNLVQGAFGEGFSDALSILRFDVPIVGEGFYGPGTFLRDIAAANRQYPCSGEIHFCGEVLAGCWWDLKEEFVRAWGPDGREAAIQLFVDWSLVTLGGELGTANSAHPLTAIEVLTIDDDDGDLGNGTPNYDLICTAFGNHGIDCPPLSRLHFAFPDGIPEITAPGLPSAFRVLVEGVAATPADGTGRLHYSIDGAPWVDTPMTSLGFQEYEATLPGALCGSRFQFFVSAVDTRGETTTLPADAPDTHFQATSAAGGLAEVLRDDMERDLGWRVGDVGDDATSGEWVREDPVASPAQPGNDHSPLGTRCWVTGNGIPGGAAGANDVDGGKTTLVSPPLDMSRDAGYRVGYWRWFSNDAGAAPASDVFRIDVSNRGGVAGSWVNVEIVGPVDEASGGWFFHEFRVEDLVGLSDQVRLRFVAEDAGANSIVEAAIDDLVVTRALCEAQAVFTRGDCDQNGVRDLGDALSFLEDVFGGGGTSFPCDDACDADDDGAYGLDDAIDLLSALFTGLKLPAPFPGCGLDPPGDGFDCAHPGSCP